MGWALVLTFLAFCPTTFAATIGSTDLPGWDEDPASQLSLSLETQREVTQTKDGLTLVLKHLPKSDAEPVLLIHGLAENDRIWDSPVKRYSFARFLHAQVSMFGLEICGTPERLVSEAILPLGLTVGPWTIIRSTTCPRWFMQSPRRPESQFG